MHSPSRGFGIYAIVLTGTNRFYIGSTIKSFALRCSQHKSTLRSNNHANKKLQNAWNKYGERAFSFEVLETTGEKEGVLEAEQRWIDTFRIMGCSLFNISPMAGAQLGYRHTEETRQRLCLIQQEIKKKPEVVQRHSEGAKRIWQDKDMREKLIRSHRRFNNSKEGRGKAGGRYAQIFAFVAPDGAIHEDIVNLSEFCRQHNLDISAMAKLYKGKGQSYKGWTRTDGTDYKQKEFAFVSPEGKTYEHVIDLSFFCDEHQLPLSEMWLLGHNRIGSCCGWTYFKKEKR